jgi:hypothetical protein
MPDLEVTRDWKALLAVLPADCEPLAHEHKQIETQGPDAKIHCADDLLRLIFVHAGAGLPLRSTSSPLAVGSSADVAEPSGRGGAGCGTPGLPFEYTRPAAGTPVTQ